MHRYTCRYTHTCSHIDALVRLYKQRERERERERERHTHTQRHTPGFEGLAYEALSVVYEALSY